MDEQAADAIEAMRLASTSTSDNQVSRPNRSRKCKPNNFDLDQGFFDVSFESMKKKKKKSSTKPNIDSWDTVQKFGAPTIPSLVNPTKRPRGRPPLSSKRQQGTANHSFGSSLGFLTSQSQYFGSSTIKSMAPYASLEAESTKVPRPPYKLVVEKVLQKLMISDPVTVLDLTRRLIDCPRDMVQAVLDIMQVLGVIVQHKTKDNFGTEYPTGAAVYSLVNFVKAPCGISFSKLQEDISLKLERMNACKGRLKKLEVRVWIY